MPGAEVSLDQAGLIKSMRWYDGFVIGLAGPGFILAGIAGSTLTLGPVWASTIWFLSALVGGLSAYIYAEPAAMFPDKSGGLSMYAKEGWRQHFSLAGPIATFGYWFAWSSVLAIYGGIIGTLLLSRFKPEALATIWHVAFFDVTWPRLIGTVCILACFIFNYAGMRPAVWFSYATGIMMVIPVAALAIIPILKGQLSNGNIDWVFNTDTINGNVSFYGGTPSMGQAIIMGIVWFWVIAWSSYFPEAPATFAPEYHDTKEDTRLALLSTSIMGVVLSALLPLTVVAVIGMDAIAKDTTYIAFLTTALDQTVGSFLGAVFTVFLCAGLLLSMNTATMDGSRALYGMAKEGLSVQWLAKLNDKNVPGRAMALDMVFNLCLLFFAPSLLFILVAGNIGYVLAHILALSGFLLLRKDRPNWPRPLRLGSAWTAIAWVCVIVNVVGTVVGIIWMKYTGYLVNWADVNADGMPNVTGYFVQAVLCGVAVIVIAVAGYVIGQHQTGKKFSFKDPSDEQPSPHVYDLMGTSAPSGD
ncbi:MAG: APC family permease [Thermoleophilia bacterium]